MIPNHTASNTGLIFFLLFVFPLQNKQKKTHSPLAATHDRAEEHSMAFTTNEADEGERGAWKG